MSFDPISSTSLEYVPVDVRAKQAGVVIDPTGDTVQMAFVSDTDTTPANDDTAVWNSASWETNSTTTPHTYTALCLVGPGGSVTLTEGNYAVFVKVTDNPEVPVKRVPGLLTVT